MAYGAQARGLAPVKLFRSVGIDSESLERRGARIPIEPIPRVWRAIGERLRDPLFGLRLVDLIPFGTADLIEYLLRHCATVGEALRAMVRFTPLLIDADRQGLIVSGNEARLQLRTGIDIPAAVELFAGMIMRRSLEIHGRSWSLLSMSFTHAAQGARSQYDRVFQAPVRFGMPFNEMVFHRDLLDLPQPGADARLKAILLAQAEEQLAALGPPPRPESFVERVQQLLAEGLVEGNPSLTRVADQLQLSMRTVQRRLRAAGVTHREVVRKLRLHLASRSLAGHEASQRQIARALGYSGVGAFHRAFKRWSGLTPGQARSHRGARDGAGVGRSS
jgi:AraC-like DNA-binding protein